MRARAKRKEKQFHQKELLVYVSADEIYAARNATTGTDKLGNVIHMSTTDGVPMMIRHKNIAWISTSADTNVPHNYAYYQVTAVDLDNVPGLIEGPYFYPDWFVDIGQEVTVGSILDKYGSMDMCWRSRCREANHGWGRYENNGLAIHSQENVKDHFRLYSSIYQTRLPGLLMLNRDDWNTETNDLASYALYFKKDEQTVASLSSDRFPFTRYSYNQWAHYRVFMDREKSVRFWRNGEVINSYGLTDEEFARIRTIGMRYAGLYTSAKIYMDMSDMCIAGGRIFDEVEGDYSNYMATYDEV
ncbi:MAG: hypothetical protein LIP06_10825 [Tannerellaceae bacterium]|nr:hypothetical protein [Tannerellaceae bacterium]